MSQFNLGNLAKELPTIQYETGLSFEDRQETWDKASDVQYVVDDLTNSKVVHYLKLGGNTMGVPAAEAIGNALRCHPEFKKAMWPNMFTRRLIDEIPAALKHLSNGLMFAKAQITVLDLSDNALGPNGMVGLEDLLKSPVCYSLQELHLNNCGLGAGGGKMLSKAIIEGHENSLRAGTPMQMKVFVAGRNRLENEGAAALAQMFGTLKTLEQISLPQNSIYYVGFDALAKGFRENTNLHVLNVNDNNIGRKGAGYLAELFAFIPKIREINFGDCLVKTDGAYLFADALADDHKNLEVLDLSFNEINGEGGICLANAMLNKPNLKTFNLDGNVLGSDGLKTIIECMKAAINPNAFVEVEENESENENDSQNNDGEEGSDDIYDSNEEEEEEEEEDDDDDDEDNTDESSNASAYVTSVSAFQTPLSGEENVFFQTPASLNTPTKPKPINQNQLSATASISADNDKSPDIQLNAVEEFCFELKPPSLEMFLKAIATPDMNFFNFCESFKELSEKDYVDILYYTTLKVANLSRQSVEALKWAVRLFKICFKHATETGKENILVVFFANKIGLIEHDCGIKTEYKNDACRHALKEAVKETNNEKIIMHFSSLSL
ncbi:ran GTPase-activating protein-like [Teleopsis dalmanni]|uniref:ran GTPase-activating protein-like n=1 Tax=Teleopsis dalmanni TaxID=139649 RepID=UPI0018CC9B94|nr:ran GTPase-activating protein-like [Teleopsis dalmanni]